MTPARARAGMVLLTTTVLTSALLLFGMEPLVGRLVVPFYGGAVQVWLTCLTFFQAALFFGYAYAHLVANRIGKWHLTLLFLPLLVLPLGVTSEIAPEWPTINLIWTLVRGVALPFAVLSTTAVVLQSWLARSAIADKHEPYPLYAASNVGSLVALLAYPFLVEPWIGLGAQSWLWSGAFVVYIGLVVACWFVVRPNMAETARAPATSTVEDRPPTWRDFAYWIALSAIPSGFLIATTNLVAGEIGSLPMVWVIPLALYLATFILAFREGGGVPRWLGGLWPELLALSGLLFFVAMGHVVSVVALILMLPALSLIAHGELYAARPHPKRLTTFYLVMAFGGWLGGSAVTFGAPLIFDGLYEYPVLLVAFGVAFALLRGRSFVAWWKNAPIWKGGPRLAGLAVLGSLIAFGAVVRSPMADLDRHRNFYGTYRVRETPISEEEPELMRRNLLHGQTLHGSEVQHPNRLGEALEYYHRSQCIAQTLEGLAPDRHIAIVGLGSGATATYTRPGDHLDYYEIDPDNERIARRWFSFLDGARGEVRIILGDGRLQLDRSSVKYDVIQIDAFSGDGIPAHLLTAEAMDTWLGHLAPDGLLLFHVSNRYYQLRPVLKAHATALDLVAAWNPKTPEPAPELAVKAHCVALARRPARLEGLEDRGWKRFAPGDGWAELDPWTDDHVNMLMPLWLNATGNKPPGG